VSPSRAGRSKDQDLIDWLAAQIQGPPEASPETAQTNGHVRTAPASELAVPADDAIIEKCCAADNAAKFSDLFDHGDVHIHHGGDESAADLALISMLTFWTQDETQLERIFSSSALGRRDKWLRRDDYRKRTIRKALSDAGEVYHWRGERTRPAGKKQGVISGTALNSSATSDTPKLSLVRFAGRDTPTAREFIVPDLIPRHHPTTLYGWGGTAKSLIALLLSMSVAGGREKFFGRDIAVHGPVMYIDFELDADEQHRRVMQLAAGMKTEVPDSLLYVSTLGYRTHDAIEFSLSVCEEHKAVMVVLDSLGPAMVGDMAAAKDVIGFHNCYIAPFKAIGATPLLVDHQARQQAGEGYQSKGAFGSAYKEHLSRSLIQVEAGDRSAEQGTLNVRLRHKKTNFGVLVDPFDVSLSFSDEMIAATTRDLSPLDRAQETTLNAEDRVAAALEDGPAYTDDLVEATGLVRGTVKNKLTALKKVGRVEITGEVRNQMEQVRLVSPAARPIKGNYTNYTPEEPAPQQVSLAAPPIKGNYTNYTPSESGAEAPATVAEFFAIPPDWLASQLKVYRQDPERHLNPLCAAVAAVVLGDGARGDEVREEVRKLA
jgi:hypothetical protein